MEQYTVTGMSCAACSARVEKAVKAVPGVTSCSVSLLTNSMGVEGTASASAIVKAVQEAGYGASPKAAAAETPSAELDALADHETPRLKKRLIASLVFLAVLMYFSMGHMMWGWPLPHWFDGNHVAMGLVQLLLAGIVMVINQKFFISGFKGLIHRAPNMDTLVALIAGFIIVPAVFATLGSENVGKGGGFAFASLAGVFEHMAGGAFFGVLFYMLLLFAALTSSISLIEGVVAFLTERFGWKRKPTTIIVCTLMFLIGCLYTMSQAAFNIKGIWFDFANGVSFPIFGDFMEFLTDRLMIPLCALGVCIFTGWIWKPANAVHEIELDGKSEAKRS